jgi:hypothetical protein
MRVTHSGSTCVGLCLQCQALVAWYPAYVGTYLGRSNLLNEQFLLPAFVSVFFDSYTGFWFDIPIGYVESIWELRMAAMIGGGSGGGRGPEISDDDRTLNFSSVSGKPAILSAHNVSMYCHTAFKVPSTSKRN